MFRVGLDFSFWRAKQSLFWVVICSGVGSIIIIKWGWEVDEEGASDWPMVFRFPPLVPLPHDNFWEYLLIIKGVILMGQALGAKASAVTIFIICGTISTFAYKLMGSQYVDEGGHHKKFFHPYMQSFTMFVGETFCIILYLANLKENQLPLEPGKTPHKFYYFLIPGLADTFSSGLQYMGLNFISGSTYLMFKGASIVTTAIFSKLLFGMVIQRRHIAGCGCAIIGLVIVGGSSLINASSSSSDTSTEILGYVLMLISLLFNGFLYAYEQLLMRRHTIDPMQMVGCEGCFGLFVITFIALCFSLTPCSLGDKLCTYDSFGNPYFERIDQFFVEVSTNWILALLVVIGIVTISAYNLNGVRITKLFDALTRSLLNITKTSVIWLVGIIITVSVGDNPDYQLESKDIAVNLVKGAGFAFIILGTLIYNKLVFKDFFADRLQKDNLEESQDSKQSLLSPQDQKQTKN